jgi:hypothetical protein
MGRFISDEEMSKLETEQSAAPSADKKFISDEEMQKLEQPQKQEPQQVASEREIGMGEAALKGAQGSLLVDEIVAGLSGAAGQAYGNIEQGKLPKMQELIDAYYEARAGQKAEKEAAFEQQPVASIVGGVGGGLLTAPLLGGVAVAQAPTVMGRIRQAALTGAKFGAATGALQGEAKLTEGVEGLKQLGKETATGALVGAGTGAALSGTVELGKKAAGIAKEIIPESIAARYQYGKKTGKMATVEDLDQEIRKASENIFDTVKNKLDEYGVQKQQAIKLADEAGERISMGEDVRKVIDSLGNKALTPSNKQEIESFKNLLRKEYLGEVDFRELTKQLSQKPGKFTASELISSPDFDINRLTVKEADDLLPQIYQLTEDKNPIISQKAKQLYGSLRTKVGEFGGISEAKEGLEAIYKPIAKNLNVDVAELNSPNKFIRDQAVADLEKKLIQSSESSRVDQRLLGESLEKYAPEAKKLMDDLEMFKQARAATFGKGRIDVTQSNILTKAAAVGGNIAGIGAGKLTGFGRSLIGKNPDQIQQIATKLSQSSNKLSQSYAKPLMDVANSNQRGREALLFTLTQQPGFRQAMQNIGEYIDEE